MRRSELTLPRGRRAGALLASLAAVAGATLAATAPAHAAGRVTVDADGKGAVIDRTYSTTLTVTGTGFQSVKGGHGGVYVWFGTVKGDWKPSKGGRSGVNYVYVPDSEAKENSGFQKYVAFPGSNTAAAANGGTMDAKGSWSTKLVVPGPKFEAVGRNGAETVDCRKVTCGVITIGAHGVRNGNNETFTPVKLADLFDEGAQGATAGSGATAGATPGTSPSAGTGSSSGSTGSTGSSSGSTPSTGKVPAGTPVRAGTPALVVDHASAVAGRAMSFSGTNLVPGEQFTVVLDNGVAAVGPFAAGSDGRATGVIQLPRTVGAGTHELRVYGASVEASVKFGVQAGDEAVAETSSEDEDSSVAASVFAGLAAVAFLGTVAVALARARRSGRAQA